MDTIGLDLHERESQLCLGRDDGTVKEQRIVTRFLGSLDNFSDVRQPRRGFRNAVLVRVRLFRDGTNNINDSDAVGERRQQSKAAKPECHRIMRFVIADETDAHVIATAWHGGNAEPTGAISRNDVAPRLDRNIGRGERRTGLRSHHVATNVGCVGQCRSPGEGGMHVGLRSVAGRRRRNVMTAYTTHRCEYHEADNILRLHTSPRSSSEAGGCLTR